MPAQFGGLLKLGHLFGGDLYISEPPAIINKKSRGFPLNPKLQTLNKNSRSPGLTVQTLRLLEGLIEGSCV